MRSWEKVRAATHLRYGDSSLPRCPDCRDPQFRIDHGCDVETEAAQFVATCPRCSGGNSKCTECDGSGTKGFGRCPASMVTPDVWALMDSYQAFDRGFLPAPGAWLDQSRVWVRLVRIIEAERNVIDEERRARQKRRGGQFE